MLSGLLVLTLSTILAANGQELLLNADFEQPFEGDDWLGNGLDISQDTDAYSGVYSCKCSGAEQDWSNLRQGIDLLPNSHYSLSAMIKLLNQSDSVLGNTVQLVYYYEENGEEFFITFATLENLRVAQGWQKIKGDFYVDNSEIFNARIQIKLSTPYVDYLVDSASLVYVPGDYYWRQNAEQRIEEIHMNDITINLRISEEYDPTLIELKMNQTSLAFPFGSAVQHYQISTDTADTLKYQDCFYENFNWATVSNALLWKDMEPVKGEIDFPDESIARLIQRGVPVRGRSVFTALESDQPEWILGLTGEALLSEMHRRIDYLVPRYAQSLAHWDVYMEYERGKYFEEHTGDPEIIAEMFRQVHELSPNTTLFLNDLNVVSESGKATQAYVNTANSLLEAGVPLQGLGVQSHIDGYPDLVELMHRLDTVASVGLPIWITELDIAGLGNRDLRAGAYDDVITIYYAHPAVQGVVLWGFHEDYMNKPDAALFQGENFYPNPAGDRWQEMMNVRWRTNLALYPQTHEDQFTRRGFYGDYEIQVFYDGDYIKSEYFTLPTGSATNIIIYVQ